MSVKECNDEDKRLIWIGCDKCGFIGNAYLKNGACPFCGNKEVRKNRYLR